MRIRPFVFPFFIIILAIQAVLTLKVCYFTKYDTETFHAQNIPATLGEWLGFELPVEDYVTKILETKDIIYRKYTRHGEGSIYMSVVYSEDNRKIVHPPEVCYTGGGWEVMHAKSIEKVIAGKPVALKELFIEQGDFQQVVWYYFKAGPDTTPNYYLQQFLVVLNKLLGRGGHAALVRISTDWGSKITPEEARSTLGRFLEDNYSLINASLP